MRLVVASLTGALFYVSVKSFSIGPLPCTTPEGCTPEAPRCIRCPGAGENTPGYCSFLDPRWQTDLCINLGYAQFCLNACADRHSISGGPIPAQGVRGPIDTGSPSGTIPETVPQSAPVTVPENAPESVPDTRPSGNPETVPNTNPTVTPETSPDNTPNVTPEPSPGTTQQSVPVTVPEVPSGTPEQQRIPAGQPGTPGTGQIQPGGSSRPSGQRRPGGRRRRPGSGKSGQTGQPAGGSGQTGEPTGGSGQTDQPAGGSGQTGKPAGGSGQTAQPEEGSTLEVWPSEKKEETPPTTPSPGDSPSGQTLQIPTIPTIPNSDGLVPDSKFMNNDKQPGTETAPENSRGNPISTPNNLSEEPSRYTPPQLAFATIGDQDGASQDVSAFLNFDTSTTS